MYRVSIDGQAVAGERVPGTRHLLPSLQCLLEVHIIPVGPDLTGQVSKRKFEDGNTTSRKNLPESQAQLAANKNINSQHTSPPSVESVASSFLSTH